MLIKNKAELNAQIKNGNLSQNDADFLLEVYKQHKRSNAEPSESNDYAVFKAGCIADGICSEDIETAWNAIQAAKYRNQ